MLPKVAIVCANYNYGRFIVEGMKSIHRQTYKGEIRLYIVDDGSSDDSWEKISEIAAENPSFVSAQRIENSGASKAGTSFKLCTAISAS